MIIEKKYKPILVEAIHKIFPGCHIWLFGSRARKTHKPGADFDLAIDAGRKLSIHEIFVIKDAIEETSIPVFVDIIDIRNTEADFLNQIKKEWIEWTH